MGYTLKSMLQSMSIEEALVVVNEANCTSREKLPLKKS